MAIPDALKQRIRELPATPGVYFFKDRDGVAIYIGKAISIRRRVSGHFRYYGESFSKEGIMLSQVWSIDSLETPTEAEALLLEASCVKEYQPKYNQDLRDDKSYPYLKITSEDLPRLLVVRGRKSDGGKYFGPYTDARLLRQAVQFLRRRFPLRTCTNLPEKACLDFHLGLCGGHCEGQESKEHYRQVVRDLERFLEGRRDSLVKELARRMREHAKNKEYEEAKALLQTLQALSRLPRKSGRSPVAEDALRQMQEVLALPRRPARLECFDISNIHGSEAVGSLVVFVDGKPSRSDYRRFRIRGIKGIDDYLMMRQVVGRRYERVLAERGPLPDLVVIDGGKGHLAAARKELERLGLSALPIISIAKEHEHIFSPHRQTPYIFSPTSPFLAVIRHLRDEAHRFAIAYHRRLHKKEALISLLDGVPGVGPKTRELLFKRVGSARTIRSLEPGELARRGRIRLDLAVKIIEALKGPIS